MSYSKSIRIHYSLKYSWIGYLFDTGSIKHE